MATYHHTPKSYARHQARQQRAALNAAAKIARRDHKRITDAIEEHGGHMSEEGKGLLTGIAETLKAVARAVRGQG